MQGQSNARIPLYLSILATLIVSVTLILAGCAEETTDNRSTPIPTAPPASGNVTNIAFSQGFGSSRDFWQVYFTGPTGSSDVNTYIGGVDTALIDAINNVQRTLDIAAFEWENRALSEAVAAAAERGVQVRMVVDDESTLEEYEDAELFGEYHPFEEIVNAGIPYRDDARSALMHNKFMIMDGLTVWTGSMNYTINGTYRNNNNMFAMRSTRIAQAYQAEFDEMFDQGEFGSSRSAVNGGVFNTEGVDVTIVFAPEDDVVPLIISQLNSAQSQVRFMAFSFTRDDIGQALLDVAGRGVSVEGIFEVRGSRTQFSELPRLFCAGVPVFEDGNPFTFHHKVFIIDDHTVLTGSFNFSDNATERNDENMVVIQDRDVAALYLAEYQRMRAQAQVPPAAQITCP